MSEALDRWESNRADTTDALVGWVRSLIPRPEDKDTATKAIYAHVRAVREEVAVLRHKLANLTFDDLSDAERVRAIGGTLG